MKVLGYLKSGQKVIDRKESHLATHDVDPELLEEAFSQIDLFSAPQNSIQTVDFGRKIGFTDAVETTDEDEIIFAKRPPREYLTRFVKNRKSSPCNLLTLIFSCVDEDMNAQHNPKDTYVLQTAHVGEQAPYEPTDPYFEKEEDNPEIQKEYQEALDFWNKHALVFNPDKIKIDPDSITKKCPW